MKHAIADKVVIVTGASSGIGRATALALAREGAALFLVARRQERLSELEAQIRDWNGRVHIQALDLRNPQSVEMMIRSALEQFGRIDILINNAAFGYFGTVVNTPPALVREIFEVNFESPLLALQHVVPIMRRQGSGHIINISSVAGKRGLPMGGVYSATKFALNAISESLRIELAGTNIFVSVINPASTVTEFGDVIRKGDIEQRFRPIGHQQSPEEVAQAIVRCIRRPKVEVYPYWPSRFVAWLNAIAPSAMDAITVRFLRDRLHAPGRETSS